MPYMDALAGSGSSSSSSSASEEAAGAGGGGPEGRERPTPGRRGEVDLAALERAGFGGGPSVLAVPDRPGAPQSSWDWSDGRKPGDPRGGGAGGGPESREEREATRHAVGAGLERTLLVARKQAERDRAVKQAARKEDRKRKQEAWDRHKGYKRRQAEAAEAVEAAEAE